LILDLYSDPELKKRFLADPAVVMKERGVTVPEEVILKAVEDSPTVRHIILPYLKPGEKSSMEEIEQRASKIII
jgi:hypothetical protein